MSSIVIAGDTSGSVTLQAPAIAGSTILNLPATSGTIQTSGAGYTTNGVAYASSTSALTTGSALTFDGNLLSNLGGADRARFGTATRSIYIAGDSSGVSLFDGAAQTGNGWYINGVSNYIAGYISTTEQMRLTSTGLGIGTSSPSTKLTVYDATTPQVTFNNGTSTFIVGNNSGGNNKILYGTGAYPMIFYTNATEGMRLDSSGNLLVGTTTSSATSGNGIKLVPGTSSACNIVGSADTNANFAHTVYSTSPAAYRFQVGWGGTIYATSTSISAISDQTLKTNVRDLETGITEVMALKPRRFDWINGDATDVAGFIAQEVEQVLPELVDDYLYSHDEDGNNIIKKSLKMGDILPTLVKAIQEQQTLINTLTERISVLENK